MWPRRFKYQAVHTLYQSLHPLLPLTFPAAQERQGRRADQRSVRGERPAAERSGDHWAAAENHREEELPAGGEDLQPEQDCARPEPLAALLAALPLLTLVPDASDQTNFTLNSQMHKKRAFKPGRFNPVKASFHCV